MGNWIVQNPQGAVYVLQEVYSSLVYALNGEQVYALDGSPVQFGYFWVNQTEVNGAWTRQEE